MHLSCLYESRAEKILVPILSHQTVNLFNMFKDEIMLDIKHNDSNSYLATSRSGA